MMTWEDSCCCLFTFFMFCARNSNLFSVSKVRRDTSQSRIGQNLGFWQSTQCWSGKKHISKKFRPLERPKSSWLEPIKAGRHSRASWRSCIGCGEMSKTESKQHLVSPAKPMGALVWSSRVMKKLARLQENLFYGPPSGRTMWWERQWVEIGLLGRRKYTKDSIVRLKSTLRMFCQQVLMVRTLARDGGDGRGRQGLSWILGSLVGCGAVNSLIVLTCKRKQIGSGYGWEGINP